MENKKSTEGKSSEGVSYKVPAGEKTLDLLDYMARVTTPQTKSEIAAGLGKSMQEIYRIIQMLVERGYLVDVENSGRFSLSMHLFAMAHQIPTVQSVSEVAAAPMRELVNMINQSAHLTVFWENDMVVISQITPAQNMFYSVSLGARFPAHKTSSGLVSLACTSQEKREQFLSSVQLQADEDLDSIKQLIDEVIEKGYDIRSSLLVPLITNISYPIYDFRGDAVAVLTIPFIPMNNITLPLEETMLYTKRAAQAISVGMGWKNT